MTMDDLILNIGGDKKDNYLYLSPELKEFEVESYEDVVEKLKNKNDFKRAVFSGGEPLENQKILELIEKAGESGLEVCVETSCIKFADREFAEKAVENGLDIVRTELHGLEEVHDEIVDGEVFEKVFEGIKNIIELGVDVSVSTIFHVRNKENLSELGDRLVELGINEWEFVGLVPEEFGKERYSEIAVPYEEIFEFLDSNVELLQKFQLVKIVNFPYCINVQAELGNIMQIQYFEIAEDLGIDIEVEPVKIDVCSICEYTNDCKGFMESRLNIHGEESVKNLWNMRNNV